MPSMQVHVITYSLNSHDSRVLTYISNFVGLQYSNLLSGLIPSEKTKTERVSLVDVVFSMHKQLLPYKDHI